MRERIEFIDRCLSRDWRLQQRSESWQAIVNKEFKMKYLDVPRNRQIISRDSRASNPGDSGCESSADVWERKVTRVGAS